MKITILLLNCLLSILPILASDISCKVERGMNILKTWTDGSLSSEIKQLLTDCTNLFQQEKYWQESGDWTQKISCAWYSGNGTMALQNGYELQWHGGTVVSNWMDPDSGAWSVFSSGGSQGAMTVTNAAGERTQIINAAILRAEWKTNGTFSFGCPGEDDQANLIFWFKTNGPSSLPWFVGGSCELAPGQKRLVRFPTPVDTIWRFIGTDKCFSCGEPCWLAGWPKPVSQTTTTTTVSSYGNSLQLSFSGAPGASYAVRQSSNLRDWGTAGIVMASGSGMAGLSVPLSSSASFFRVEAVQTATMTEEETACALREIRDFDSR